MGPSDGSRLSQRLIRRIRRRTRRGQPTTASPHTPAAEGPSEPRSDDQNPPAAPTEAGPPAAPGSSPVVLDAPGGEQPASADRPPPQPPRRPTSPLPVRREVQAGTHIGERYVRVVRPPTRLFRQISRDHVLAGPEATAPRTLTERVLTAVRRILIGPPLASAEEIHERLPKWKALAVFASDALSSCAYATEEILVALLVAGTASFWVSLPIAIAIAVLLVIVVFSYRQTVHAYPQGGGSYLVTKDNLGIIPGLTAAAGLQLSYALTVAVSIAAGAAAMTSAFPILRPYQVGIAVAAIVLMTLINLRGIRESGTAFAVPTYGFLVCFAILLGWGLGKALVLGDPLATGTPRVVILAAQPLTVFLVLRAFSSGAVALTGTEAIADGVAAFKPPEARNAATTLVWMAIILGTLFIGITVLAQQYGVVPQHDGETVVSQVARLVLGGGHPLYYTVQAAVTLILILAANTAFADFPRLASILARDRYVPTHFSFRGDRLAFSNGIIVLGTLAAVLVVVFQGSTHALIPLYSVGVFLAFTCSQASMVRRWARLRSPYWQRNAAINGVGTVLSGTALLVVAITKFTEGAWIVIVLIPLLVQVFRWTHSHYQRMGEALHLDSWRDGPPPVTPQEVIVPVADVNRSTLRALAYARSLSDQVTAVHVTDDLEGATQLREKWERWARESTMAAQHLNPEASPATEAACTLAEVPLVIIESPYRSLLAPLVAYIDQLDRQNPDMPVTVVIPEALPTHWWLWGFHNQTALQLKAALLFRPNTVVVNVPLHVEV